MGLRPSGRDTCNQLLRKGVIMKPSNRGLTTFAVAAAIGSLAILAVSTQSEAQTAIPNAESNRFTPSTLRVDPETTAADGVPAASAAAPDAGAQAVSPEPPSRG